MVMEEQPFQFTLNETPPFFKSVVYGLQWVMIAIPGVVVFSTICSTALGLDPAAQVSFSQRLLIATGLITLLQSLKGHCYPVLEGPSSALLLSFVVLAPAGLSAIEGGLIVGGLLLIAVSLFKWFKWLSPFFGQNIVGVILMLVSSTLVPFVSPLLIGINPAHPHGDLSIFGSSLLTILLVSFLSHWLKGFLQTTSMLLGILFGLILFLAQGKVSLNLVQASGWLALPSPLWGVWPTFSPASVLVFIFTYLAVMINSVGSIQGISEIVGKEGLENRIHRGIGITGAGGMVAGVLGVAGLVSLSISPGVVLVSRVASRYVLAMSGGILIVCAFIPKLWALLNAIPPSVTASVLFVALSTQLMAGMNAITAGKGKIERREYFTVGLPLLLGTSVSILPKPFFQLFPSFIASLVSNGLVVGILFALLFEHVIFKKKVVKGFKIVHTLK
jgi:xanthine/uracil permease